VALTALCSAQVRGLLGVRAAAVVGWLIATGFGVTMLVAGRRAAGASLAPAVAWLSWLAGGLAALSAARNPGGSARDGVSALLVQRGHDPRTLPVARLVANMTAIARVVGRPALGLGLLGLVLSGSAAMIASRAALVLGAVCYAAVLGAVLGGLAAGCAALSPRRASTWLLGLVIGPELARVVWPRVPSVPDLLRAVWHALLASGGAP
jgi:hypothetical protein